MTDLSMAQEDELAARRYLLRAAYQRFKQVAKLNKPAALKAARKAAVGMLPAQVIDAVGIEGYRLVQRA